jgi:hypothetical protein
MSSLQEWLPPGERIETLAQFDAFQGYVSSQRLGPKTAAHPDLVLLSLLKTRLGKGQSVQQMYASSVLEAESAHPSEDEEGAGTAADEKKRVAAFLDTVLIAFGRRLQAAAATSTSCSFMLKAELHNPKNPEYAAICDTESTKGALDAMLLKLRAAGVPVSLEELRDAFLARLPELFKTQMILHGCDRLAARGATADVYMSTYQEALRIEMALRAAGAFTPRDVKATGTPKRTREQRLAALGDGSRRGDDDSRRGKRSGGTS